MVSECDDDGELRKFVYGLKLLIEKNNDSFTSLDANIIRKITTGFKDEASDDLSIILSSQILSDSIKHNILKLKQNPNTQEGFLIIDIYEEDWLDGPSPYYRPGEIRNLIRALQLLFPDGDIFNLSFDQELISSISDGTVDTNGDGYLDENDDNDLRDILRSKIVSDTIIFLAIDILN